MYTSTDTDLRITDDYIFVKSNSLLQRVDFQDILYIESEGNYCTIVTAQRRHVVKISLTRLLGRLDLPFIRQVHRSYAVNESKIDSIDTTNSSLTVNGESVPLGRKFRDDLLNGLDVL